MGFFTGPTKEQVGQGLAGYLDGQTVHAFVIGMSNLGRTAIVATDQAAYVVLTKMNLRTVPSGVGLVARYPLGSVVARLGGVTGTMFTVGDCSVKLGIADRRRATELEAFVNSSGRLSDLHPDPH